MPRYIALLRGVNVGGGNKVPMAELKASFEAAGLQNVSTYINSGNVIFDSELDQAAVKNVCEALVFARFMLRIPVGIITAAQLHSALCHAPAWWDHDPDAKHNAIFVIPPATCEMIFAQLGETKPEYEKIAYHENVIFWFAPVATFSRTRLTKIVQSKAAYNAITIRNANTTRKLAQLAQQ